MEGLARVAMGILNESAEYLIPLSWSMNNVILSPGAQDRYALYQGIVLPTASFGGTHLIHGWDCTITNFNEAYDDLVTLESPFSIDLTFEQIREDSFEITAEVSLAENITSINNKIFFVITNWAEYSTAEPWIYLVVAKSDEEDVLLTNSGETATYNAVLDFEMLSSWNIEDLHAVAIIQNWDDLEILQAAQNDFIPTSVDDPVVVVEASLHQNYPNPFNPSTTISYDLNEQTQVQLSIFNVKGQKIITLVNDNRNAGIHSVIWNGRDENGKSVPSGIYLYKLQTEKNSSIKKMILMK